MTPRIFVCHHCGEEYTWVAKAVNRRYCDKLECQQAKKDRIRMQMRRAEVNRKRRSLNKERRREKAGNGNLPNCRRCHLPIEDGNRFFHKSRCWGLAQAEAGHTEEWI